MFYCKKGLKIRVLRSNNYYIGTTDEEGVPNCRLSGYFNTRKQACTMLNSGIFDYGCDNYWCSCGDCGINRKED